MNIPKRDLKDIDPRTCTDKELEEGRQRLTADIIRIAAQAKSPQAFQSALGDYLRAGGLPMPTVLGFGVTRFVLSLPLWLVLKIERPLNMSLVDPDYPNVWHDVSPFQVFKHVAKGQTLEKNTANYSEEQNARNYPWLLGKVYGTFCKPFDSDRTNDWPESLLIQERLIPLKQVLDDLTSVLGDTAYFASQSGMQPKTGVWRFLDGGEKLYPPAPDSFLDNPDPSIFDCIAAQQREQLTQSLHTTNRPLVLRNIDPHTATIVELEAGRCKLAKAILAIAEVSSWIADFESTLERYLVTEGLAKLEKMGNGMTRIVYALPLWMVLKIDFTNDDPASAPNFMEKQNTDRHPWLFPTMYGSFYRPIPTGAAHTVSLSIVIQERLVPICDVRRETQTVLGDKAQDVAQTGIQPRTGRWLHMDGARTYDEGLVPPSGDYKLSTLPSFFDGMTAH